jgi:hypothetical protein
MKRTRRSVEERGGRGDNGEERIVRDEIIEYKIQ